VHQPGYVLAKPNLERRASAQQNAGSSSRQELRRKLQRQSPKPVAALWDRTRNRLPVIRYWCPSCQIDAVEPTPFQRDLSDAHHKRLADVINKTGRFLDPIIAVVAPKGGFWTPNGRHRLEAMRRLGAKSITALVVADREVAWQILALNTEKAHNLKERSLEVIRIYRDLVDEDATRPESQFAFYLDEPALVTLGVCYERLPRFGGGAYHSILRRLESFTDEPLRVAVKDHEKRATMVHDLEERVAAAVKKLKERGLVSPYPRSFVVARINPLRWIKGEPPPLEEVLRTMRERAAKFNVEKIKPQDLAGAAGPPDEEG
jgi:ParB family chromosome partitioning protein